MTTPKDPPRDPKDGDTDKARLARALKRTRRETERLLRTPTIPTPLEPLEMPDLSLMSDDERGDALLMGFLLGLKALTAAHDLEIPATAAGRPWRLLTQVAAGEVTLTKGLDRLLAESPNADPEFAKGLRDSGGRLEARDRDAAALILAAFERMRTHVAGTSD